MVGCSLEIHILYTMCQFENITLIILAGGKSSRMGTDKALLKYNGKTFVQILHDNLKELFTDVIISSNNPKVKINDAKTISDKIKDIGPIGGIYSCLTVSNTNKNFIVSVDTPFVSPSLTSTIISLSEGYDISVVKHKNKVNPIIGIYSKSVLPIVEQEIKANNYKMMMFLEKTKHQILDVNNYKNDLKNINTIDDFYKLD